MLYDSYNKTDAYYEFIKGDIKTIAPVTAVILVKDESGLLSIKTIATRKTIGLVPENE